MIGIYPLDIKSLLAQCGRDLPYAVHPFPADVGKFSVISSALSLKKSYVKIAYFLFGVITVLPNTSDVLFIENIASVRVQAFKFILRIYVKQEQSVRYKIIMDKRKA